MQKRDFETCQKRFRDFEILPKFSETHVFRGTIHHPYLRGFPHLMLGNQCLGTSTKWCCVHTLITRYVSVYIVTPFRPLSSLLHSRF